MTGPAFAQLLHARIGLDAATVGAAQIERAVRQRQAACRLRDAQAYWELLQQSESELQELIEAVVVPETWFYRDREAFAALSGVVLHEWLQACAAAGGSSPDAGPPDRPFRLLSLPCATGEEPYSMAMALLDAGFPADRLQIDAVDISRRAIEQARIGVYGQNSFRGADLAFRERYFERQGSVSRIVDAVRRPVQFRQGNLFDATLAGPYDVIFCRNVLIYFDRATQDRAVQILSRLLTPQGFLFVGPSETPLLMGHDLASARLPFAFAFRKGAPAPAAPAVAPRAARPEAPLRPRPVRPVLAAPARRPAPAPTSPPPAAAGLERAIQLADQGHLAEAAHACEAHLRRHGPSAEGFHLLGLIRDAGGDAGAAAGLYRKALYLDPHHPEALTHLALLLERQGDPAAAQVLRQRALRPLRESRK